ncbi:MAG: hypothetical protein O9254_00130 [Rhodobacteraceae bacterium]|nr:hypothetical protein [Paracoccaceae bacterium]
MAEFLPQRARQQGLRGEAAGSRGEGAGPMPQPADGPAQPADGRRHARRGTEISAKERPSDRKSYVKFDIIA